jgi:hypothetical protein
MIKRCLIMVAVVAAVLVSPVMDGQSSQQVGPVTTTGTCSPVLIGNGEFRVVCPGLTKEQSDKMLELLNKILANQSDTKTFDAKLDAILAAVNNLQRPKLVLDDEHYKILVAGLVPLKGKTVSIFVHSGNADTMRLREQLIQACKADDISVTDSGFGFANPPPPDGVSITLGKGVQSDSADVQNLAKALIGSGIAKQPVMTIPNIGPENTFGLLIAPIS